MIGLCRKPFLASGKIIENYSLLVKYFEICSASSNVCMDLLPSSEILETISSLVKNRGYSFTEILNVLGERLSGRIICNIAVEAYRAVHGINVDCEEAKNMLLRELVAWYLEMAEALGLVRLKESWKPG